MQNTPCDVRPQPQTRREPPEGPAVPRGHSGGDLNSDPSARHHMAGWGCTEGMDARHPTPVQLLRGMAMPWGSELAASQVTPNPEPHTEPPQESYHLAPQLPSPAAWVQEATWKQGGEAPPPSQEPHCAAQVGGSPT